MTEDKDLAIEFYERQGIMFCKCCHQVPVNCRNYDPHSQCKKNLSVSIKEERRRLLNDPRIKAMAITAADLKSSGYDELEMKMFERALSGFESLLKENEGG